MNDTTSPNNSGKQRRNGSWRRTRCWLSAAASMVVLATASGASHNSAPAVVQADVCGSVGARHVTVGGCTDVIGTVEQYADAPNDYPPPAESTPPPPPPDPAGSLYACANVGRHVSVSGCVDTG